MMRIWWIVRLVINLVIDVWKGVTRLVLRRDRLPGYEHVRKSEASDV